MNPPNDLSKKDHALLDLLSRGLDEVEPLPESALEQAYSARFMAAVTAELAELIYDSSAVRQPAMRRGNEDESRFLRFTNESVTLDLSLLADGQTLVGEVDPAIASELTVETGDGSVVVPIDQFGRFRVSNAAASFRIRVVGHLVTQWISR